MKQKSKDIREEEKKAGKEKGASGSKEEDHE